MMSKYSESDTNNLSSSEKWNVYYEAAKLEYEYAVTNSSKLDSKAYTLLTACAFMFAALYTVMSQIEGFFAFIIAKGNYGYVIAFLFFILLVAAGIFLGRAIFLLIDALNISAIGRANIYDLVQSDIPQSEDYEVALKRFAITYSYYVEAGKEHFEAKQKKLAKSIEYIYYSLYAILIILVVLLSRFLFQS